MKTVIRNIRTVLVPLVLAAQLVVLTIGTAGALPVGNLKVKILAINDFHGQLSPKTVGARPAGGAAVLASYLKSAQAVRGADQTIIVSDGDFIGASPANSALLQDEPSIMFLNTLANSACRINKMDSRCNIVATIGNHELDEGVSELGRMMNGGNYQGNPVGVNAGPFLENLYGGAHFPYVAANVIVTATGKPLLPPYVIKTVRNTPIAFIGAILKDTPNIVAPTGVAGLTFTDEADAINNYLPELRAKGVKAIIALIHQGGTQSGATISGDITTIVGKLDGAVDVVISGHTHTNLNGLVKNKGGNDVLVTQAYSAGTAFADIDLELDPVSKDIVKKSALITTTYGDTGPGLTPDATVANIVAAANVLVAPKANTVVGQVPHTITRTQNSAGESALGDLIADAQRAYEGTDFAFMNPGGIRDDIRYQYNAFLTTTGDVTWGDLFSVQPFSNQMVTMTMTGQQIYDLLAQQWSNPSAPKMLQISGLTYTWRDNGAGQAGTIVEVRKNGIPIGKGATYTVTTNNFLAAGGDGFTVFKSGLNQILGAFDIDVLVAYLKGLNQPFDAVIDGRIGATLIQFVYTSDAHYGITRTNYPTAGSATAVDAHIVNADMITVINGLPTLATPCDTGVNACATLGAVDFVAETGDIANRMETGIQSAASSWGQFQTDYLTNLTVKNRINSASDVYLVPGNHDVSNAVGFYKTMSPTFDATSYVNIYNRMMNPGVALTNTGFIGAIPTATIAAASYSANRVHYSRNLGGVHFVFLGMWPDSAARTWLDTDLSAVSSDTPVVLFTHDQPDIETKHLMNPNGSHTINATDKFENLVYGEAGGYAGVTSVSGASTVEQAALAAWLKNHKNVVAYFHGNSNWNQFYTFAGPNNDISLNIFRVDSPMKGNDSATNPSLLSFQVISIDTVNKNMTVREYLWNTKSWGASTTVSLLPRIY